MSNPKCYSCPVTGVDLKLTAAAPDKTVAAALPPADFLVLVWTEHEAGAFANVFGEGRHHFLTYADNSFTPLILPGMSLPSGSSSHGNFFVSTVNGKKVVCLQSNFHPKLGAIAASRFFEAVLGKTGAWNFGCLITSGTAGGIWAILDLGDVVVTNAARYGLTMTVEQQAMLFTGLPDLVGAGAPAGSANWYEYVNTNILARNACVNSALGSLKGRKAASGPPKIYYADSGSNFTDVVTNSRVSDDEFGRISTYRTLGATLDENDAYVAETCQTIGYAPWVSIRNVSDLPGPNSDFEYDTFGFCTATNGAYAIWAFVMGH